MRYHIFGGRFQPFHIGHLAVLERLSNLNDQPIIVGIVNPDPKEPFRGDDGRQWLRFAKKSNPLNYWERLACIKAAVRGRPCEQRIEAIVPLPRPSINLKRADRYLPPKPRTFVLCHRWGDEVETWKAEKHRQNDESVLAIMGSELSPITQLARGEVIRAMIALGNPAWKLLIPSATVKYLEGLEFSARIATSISRNDAAKTMAEFYKNDVLGELAAELFGDLYDIEKEDRELDLRNLVWRKLSQRLRSPIAEDDNEITVLLESEERVELERVTADMVRTSRLRVTPHFISVAGDLHQAVLAIESRDAILSVISDLIAGNRDQIEGAV